MINVIESSEGGNRLKQRNTFEAYPETIQIKIDPSQRYQQIIGFGGSFTKSTAVLFQQLSKAQQENILEAYFGSSGAQYSLTRIPINSSDFSPNCYSYAPVENDFDLLHFSIKEETEDLIPMIKAAKAVSKEGFKIMASPWTAPPWMKDNQDWIGGKLLPACYPVWALFFAKFLSAYQNEQLPIWGITVENEPLGNGNNWESMHFTPQEMNDFVVHHLKPMLQQNHETVKILGYDQNRDEALAEWADAMYLNPQAKAAFDGIALHWYGSTVDHFPQALQDLYAKAPTKYRIQTEACIDAQVPRWKDDAWYWRAEATDWGWDWAPEDKKHLHPKYAPVFRYAQDIIGCLNNWVEGWIDWNMILDRQGGPNWAKNWCIAPVIVHPETDEVYFTPLFDILTHFSRFIRPNATRIATHQSDDSLNVTAIENINGGIVVVLFNPTIQGKEIQLSYGEKRYLLAISPKAMQTITIS